MKQTFPDGYAKDLYRRMRQVLSSDMAWKSSTLSLGLFARMLGVPVKHVHAAFHEGGTTFYDLINEYRVNEAVRLLSNSDITFFEASYRAGFGSYGSFVDSFRKKYGKLPQDAYGCRRKNGRHNTPHA
jgi:AraC-like DNA-binding protein